MQSVVTAAETHFVALLLALGNRVPIKLQIPVEATDVDSCRVPEMELQSGIINHVNYGAHHIRRVLGDAVEQRLQPTCFPY